MTMDQIDYAWSFPSIDTVDLIPGPDAVVSVIHWELMGTDAAGRSASSSGAFPITYDAGQPFIPLADVNDDVLTGWAEARVLVEEVKAAIAGELAAIATAPALAPAPPVANPLNHRFNIALPHLNDFTETK